MATGNETGVRVMADEALIRLKAGNRRFLRSEARFPTVQKDVLAGLAKRQQPYATILGCSDSRVPPELVFDAGFGELFVIRVAGNVISAAILGTLQYATRHLRTSLFVVLGHRGCGAVSAALAAQHAGAPHPERIDVLLRSIRPAIAGLDPSLPADHLLDAGVEANVRWSMQQLLELPEAEVRLREGDVKLVGAVYDLETGEVRFLP